MQHKTVTDISLPVLRRLEGLCSTGHCAK